jgi:septal ring factor EnvC (AmiA/AmiB activator)
MNDNSRYSQHPKPCVEALPDGPPRLSPIDTIIKLHHGSSSAIEATPQRLQAAKQQQFPSFQEEIEQLQKQNSSLNHEMAYYRQMEQARKEFEKDVSRTWERLQKALQKLRKDQQHVDHEWQLPQGYSGDGRS